MAPRHSYEHKMTLIHCRQLADAHEKQQARRNHPTTATMLIEGLALGGCLLVVLLLIELFRVFRVS